MRGFRKIGVGAGGVAGLLFAALGWAQAGRLPSEPTKRQAAPWTLDRSTFDRSADACSDFYQYVCGGYQASARIPPDRPSVSWSRDRVDTENRLAIDGLLRGKDTVDDPEVRRLRTFYSSCMRHDGAAERARAAVVGTWVRNISTVANASQLMDVLFELHAHGVNAFFQYSGEPSSRDRTRYRAEIHQGSIGLRARQYVDSGEAAGRLRREYRAHVAKMFELAGMSRSTASRDAEVVFRMETQLAADSISNAERFDASVSENPISMEALIALAPHINWTRYLSRVGYLKGWPLNVTSPRYLRGLDEVLTHSSIDEQRVYLFWRWLDSLGPALPEAMAAEHYRFASWPLALQRSPSAECELETLKAMGVELSRQFSLRFGGAQVRARAASVIQHVQEQVIGSLDSVAWLSARARAAAQEKMRRLDLKVGYPELWPATGSFPLQEQSFLENVLAARAFLQSREWSRAQSARLQGSWEIRVFPNAAPGFAAARLTIANAYPDQSTNSMIVTAAYLRVPLFDADAPVEVRYGAFGTVMAHELVHVLENHQFDANGELNDSWSSADVAAHGVQRNCLAKDAERDTVIDNLHLDGQFTLDENTADLSGVPYAYAAMERELGARVHERGEDGYTAAQRFFVAFAQPWCDRERPDSLRQSVGRDPHAPSRFRVNEPLSNMPQFGEAFGCEVGSPMRREPAAACKVW